MSYLRQADFKIKPVCFSAVPSGAELWRVKMVAHGVYDYSPHVYESRADALKAASIAAWATGGAEVLP